MNFKDGTQRSALFHKGDSLLLAVLRRLNGLSEFLYETFGETMGERFIVIRHFSPDEPNKAQVELDDNHSYWREMLKKDLNKMVLQNSRVKYDHINTTRDGHYFKIETNTEQVGEE